jgi:UDP-N-acetylglucosamine transferase subunit ALG13
VSTAPAPRLVVTVGTDHHPFDRLMGWIDDLVATTVLPGHQMLVQFGSSRRPRTARVRVTIPRSELLALMARADVVIGHGGPGTIMDARGVGRRPIVVPRLARHGEVVDDHQVTFSRRLAESDKIVLAEDRETFTAAVRQGLAEPDWLAVHGSETRPNGADEVAWRIDRVVEGLRSAPRPPVVRRIGQLWISTVTRPQPEPTASQLKSRPR